MLIKDCERDARLMNEYMMYLEVKAMQNGKVLKAETGEPLQQVLCNRNRIDKLLNVVLNCIYQLNPTDSEKFKGPLGLELKIEDDLQLRLFVEWFPGLVEVLHLHKFKDLNKKSKKEQADRSDYSFKNDGNFAYKFISGLLTNSTFKMNPSEADGLNAIKYLKRVGIKGALYQLLIAHTTGFSAELTPKRSDLSGASVQILKMLCKQLAALKTVRWDRV